MLITPLDPLSGPRVGCWHNLCITASILPGIPSHTIWPLLFPFLCRPLCPSRVGPLPSSGSWTACGSFLPCSGYRIRSGFPRGQGPCCARSLAFPRGPALAEWGLSDPRVDRGYPSVRTSCRGPRTPICSRAALRLLSQRLQVTTNSGLKLLSGPGRIPVSGMGS